MPAGAFRRISGMLSSQSLRDRALSSGAVLLAGEAYSNLLRLLANLLMTRLLYPEAFGVMLVINIVFSALAMLSDVGVRSAIISKTGDLDQNFINVAYTVMVVRGFVLGLVAILIAKPIAVWYEHPALFELLLLASLAPMISGFTSPYPRIAEKQINLGRVTLWQVMSQTAALAITVTWLLIHPTVWALAANGVVSAVILCITSFMLFDSAGLKIEWDQTIVRELFHFGKWVLLGTALTFMGRQGDSLIVSRFLNLEVLGVFSIAISFAKLLEMIGERLSWGLLFPVYSEMKTTDESFASRSKKLRLGVYALCFPAVLVLSIGGRELIDFLYDPRYEAAGWMLEVMALGMGFYVIASTVNSIPLAFGESQRHMWLQFARVACVLAAMACGGWVYDTEGLIWGIAIGQVLYYPFLQIGVRKYRPGGVGWDLLFGGGTVLLVVGYWAATGWPLP